MIDLKHLIKNAVQFGHQSWRWNPKMAPYIWGQKNGIHLIDVSKTAFQIEKAGKFLESVAAEGKTILWCGTKKSAQHAIDTAHKETGFPAVTHRWIGGTLTNYIQVKKSVTKLLHLEDVLAKGGQTHYTKKELNVFQKMIERLNKNVGGIRKLVWPVGALVVVDAHKEHVAIKEAVAAGVPVVAIVDTNTDPSGIDFVIPANDDAPRSVECVIAYLIEAAKRGQDTASTRQQEETLVETISVEKMLADALGADEASAGEKKKGGAARRPARRPVGPARGPRK